ncbi:MAG: SUF system NifU family Fe-S cluster assembly protein [Phycisphaerales bacterium]|nr:SUF system NifU family Fe-S cluster assembly protein [Phycisphaerales bacterium]
MSELQDLYQELILDHNRRPRNRRRLEHPDRHADGFNPLCGDRVSVYVKLDGDVIQDVAFEGRGCAISTASASLMTEALKGKTVAEAKALFERFHNLVTGESDGNGDGPALGKLEVFSGVSRYPARVKCASLVWHAVNAALEDKNEVVSTE